MMPIDCLPIDGLCIPTQYEHVIAYRSLDVLPGAVEADVRRLGIKITIDAPDLPMQSAITGMAERRIGTGSLFYAVKCSGLTCSFSYTSASADYRAALLRNGGYPSMFWITANDAAAMNRALGAIRIRLSNRPFEEWPTLASLQVTQPAR